MEEQERATADEHVDLEANHANGTPHELPAEEAEDRALMEQFLRNPAHDYRNLQYGDTVDGTIMRVDRDEILVDIGSKAEGVVPAREMQSLASEDRAALRPGDELLVFVVQNPDQVPFQFLGWHWNLSLGVATLFAAIAGGLVTVAVGMVRIIQLRRVAKKSLKGH